MSKEELRVKLDELQRRTENLIKRSSETISGMYAIAEESNRMADKIRNNINN